MPTFPIEIVWLSSCSVNSSLSVWSALLESSSWPVLPSSSSSRSRASYRLTKDHLNKKKEQRKPENLTYNSMLPSNLSQETIYKETSYKETGYNETSCKSIHNRCNRETVVQQYNLRSIGSRTDHDQPATSSACLQRWPFGLVPVKLRRELLHQIITTTDTISRKFFSHANTTKINRIIILSNDQKKLLIALSKRNTVKFIP